MIVAISALLIKGPTLHSPSKLFNLLLNLLHCTCGVKDFGWDIRATLVLESRANFFGGK